MFVESIQSTKVWCHTGGGKGASCAELWCHNSREVDCLAARRPHEKQSGDYYVPIFGRLSGAQSANIGDLSGKTCHHTGYGNIEICEYGGLAVTLGGERVIIGVLRWGWVEVILRVSLEVILHHLLRHAPLL